MAESHGEDMKRHKKSKFDPYINEIWEYMVAGMTLREIAERLDEYFDDIVSEDAVYAFINSRRLRGLRPETKIYHPPVCDQCEGCHEVIGLNGKMVRVCYYTQLISWSVKTSPQWCYKRAVNQ